MTRQIVPFKRWHMDWLEARSPTGIATNEATCAQLETQYSWTAVLDGEVIACGGTVEQWPGRHLAWTHLGPHTAKHMLWLTRAVRSKLKAVQGRVEMAVRCGFEPGHRWAEMLGFSLETPIMSAYGPDGADHSGYVRINR